MKKRSFKLITAVMLSLMLVVTMSPAAVFADTITVKLTIKNDTFTTPLINDSGVLKKPAWTGTFLNEYPLEINDGETLADAMLDEKALVIENYPSDWGNYFAGFNGLSAGLGIKTGLYDSTGWLSTVDGVDSWGVDYHINGDATATQSALAADSEVVFAYTMDFADTSNPYLPGDVTDLTAANAGNNTIALAWKKADRAEAYVIYRSKAVSGPFEKIGTTKETKYTDSNVAAGQDYYYKVAGARSTNLQNTGSFSNLATATIPAVSKVTLSKPSIKIAKSGKKALKISWKKVNGAEQYQVYRATKKNGKYKKIKTVSAGKTSYINKNLKKGKKYYYKVKAVAKVNGKEITGGFSSVKWKKR